MVGRQSFKLLTICDAASTVACAIDLWPELAIVGNPRFPGLFLAPQRRSIRLRADQSGAFISGDELAADWLLGQPEFKLRQGQSSPPLAGKTQRWTEECARKRV
jgi:hypothetical protein